MENMIPRILLIDDIFGSSTMDRRNLCRNFALVDVTGDDEKPASIQGPIAEAVFCSGQVRQANTVKNDVNVAIEIVNKGWDRGAERQWALILLDLRFVSGQIVDGEPEGQPGDDSFGLVILDAVHERFPDMPIVIISSRERAGVIEDCRRRGASDFIQRHEHGTATLSPKEILRAKILEHGLIEDSRDLTDEKNRIIGKSVEILKTLRAARRAATGKGNILILGETGTGKELLARYIHDLSPKSEGPYKFYPPHGTAETLQEDELFGHVKGAFTGANFEREGLFEMANGGTLFIDEIGDIPEGLQNKLLRPIENRVVKRQGGNKQIPIDVQIVLATNKNLEEHAKTGKFKSDLLNRINAYTITLPPLRERKEDIPLISERLLEVLCKENNAHWPREILPETMTLLKNHGWRDNVRGLRNALERAIKDNRDSELIVPSDIRFDTDTGITEGKEDFIKTEARGAVNTIDELIAVLSSFEFPEDYSKISGKLPALQGAVAKMMATYLQSSIEVTKKMKPGGSPEGEINLTGAASCMMGKQLKTPKAADMIKKLLQLSPESKDKIISENEGLRKIFEEAIKLRPSNSRKKK